MQTTTYHCDKCKTEVPTDKDLFPITGNSGGYKSPPKGWTYVSPASLKICMPCAIKAGLLVPIKEGDDTPPPETDQEKLFNLLVAIAYDAAGEALSNSQ